MTDAEIIKLMDESRFVKKRELPNTDGIVSYNYDKKAFWKGMWDVATIHARGLFIRNGKVVARSFDKFFRLNEHESSSSESIKKKMSRPDLVRCRVLAKYNGYLGVCSWDDERGEWFIASKSTNAGPYAETFRAALDASGFLKRMEALPRESILGYSFVFEVFSDRDPHFTSIDRPLDCQLIAVFRNDLHNDGLTIEEMKSRFGIVDGPMWSMYDMRFCSMMSDLAYGVNNFYNTEGMVAQLEFANGEIFRFKVKTAWYSFWKYVRGQLMKSWGECEHPFIPYYDGRSEELVFNHEWMDRAVNFVNRLSWETLETFKTPDLLGNKRLNMVQLIAAEAAHFPEL